MTGLTCRLQGCRMAGIYGGTANAHSHISLVNNEAKSVIAAQTLGSL